MKFVVIPSTIVKQKIPVDPQVCILNYMNDKTSRQTLCMSVGFMSAKRIMAADQKTIQNMKEKSWL